MLNELNHPSVRDLAWCFLSPPLLSRDELPEHVVEPELSETVLAALEPHIRALDHDPSELEDFLGERPTRRVGRYFEQLVEYGLSRAGIKLLATNYQLHHGKRVIGELDYLFEHEGQVEHWETAIKFYLEHESSESLSHFVGPNAADNLGLKVARILDHQLPMGQHPATQEIEALAGRPVNSRAFVRGRLFYHHARSSESLAPSPVSPGHLVGWWRFAKELPLPDHSSSHGWIKADKPCWLAPLRVLASSNDGVMTDGSVNNFVADHFAQEHYPLLMVEVRRMGAYWEEVSRGFIVNNAWPAPNPPKPLTPS